MSGFYRYDGDRLWFAPNRVLGRDFELLRGNKDRYTYPVHGWTWFDSEDDAVTGLGVPVSTDSDRVAAALAVIEGGGDVEDVKRELSRERPDREPTVREEQETLISGEGR